MTRLRPPSNGATAAQTAPRMALLTDGQDRSFLATSLANPLGSCRQNKNSEHFEIGTCKETDPTNSAPHLTSSPAATTETLSARQPAWFSNLPKILASSTAATFNRGMQRTREGFLKIHGLRAAGRPRFSAPAFSAFLYKFDSSAQHAPTIAVREKRGGISDFSA
jgi:hypothetical protein